jgi:hypothetical protein
MRDGWQSRSSRLAVPLSNIQMDVLRLLASQRDPESYVAGATPLNRSGLRYSGDIDVFHDREERVAAAAANDVRVLEAAGYAVKWLRQLPTVCAVEVGRQEARTRLEWVVDSDFRFFPTIRDDTFGYVLHPVDLATNKAMAAAGRRELRDLIDLATIHETILPLGAVVWAAVEKSPGFTPEGLIAEIRRNANHPLAEWRSLDAAETFDPAATTKRLTGIFAEAEAFVARMPTDKAGLLFMQGADVLQPDPDRLDDYRTHAGQRRGHWPTSPEIAAAMFERTAQSNAYCQERERQQEQDRGKRR